MRQRSLRDDDAGFTLIELLITIVILGVITLPLGNFVIEYFRYTADATGRVNESHDAQIAAAYFAQDVASLGTRNQSTQVLGQSIWTGDATGAPYACGSATPIVLFAGDRFTGPGSPTVIEIAYVAATVGSEHQLQRVVCSGTSSSAVTNVLAHDVDPSTAPAVTCFLTGAGTPCGGSGSSVPTSVQLVLALQDPVDATSSYSVTLSGERRQT